MLDAVGTIILGKEHSIRLALTAMIARGHLLIEDIPGVGKTTLSHTLAQVMGLDFQRVQFTSDLLPADILGMSIYNRNAATFDFHPGPVFTHVLLADEINRATPRTQSALLEAMEERQVTQEKETRSLPDPFFVIATQNPITQMGTYPLPESQLDRFLLCIRIGYPETDAERELLGGVDRRSMLSELRPILDVDSLRRMQEQAMSVHVSPALLEYILELLRFSRESGFFIEGLSPRAGLALLHCAKAWAFLHESDYVTPDHVRAVLSGIVQHRLMPVGGGKPGEQNPATILLQQVAVPE